MMTLDLAVAIVDGALAKGAAIDCDPLTVAVLDAGGHLVALKRQDESGILRVEIAVGKAYGALGFGVLVAELEAALGEANAMIESFLAGEPVPQYASLRRA